MNDIEPTEPQQIQSDTPSGAVPSTTDQGVAATVESNGSTDTQEKQAEIPGGAASSPADRSVAPANGQPPTAIDDVVPPPPPDDPAVYATQVKRAIHNAFLMGWSLQELKSTVLLGALALPQPSSVVNPAPAPGSTNGSPAPAPGPTDGGSAPKTQHSLPDMVNTLLQGALASAVSVISQLQGLPGGSNGSLVQTSDLRANFIRLATVHDQCFPGSTTENTPYDPSPGEQPESRFPFLYPNTSPAYALIGINDSSSVGFAYFNDDKHLGNFKLYDVTRRALNCLTLLNTKPAESLLPDLVSDFQRQIVESLGQTQLPAKASQNVSGGLAGKQDDLHGGTTADQENPQVGTAAIVRVLEAYMNEASAGPPSDRLNQAITALSFLIVRFLDSWDGFLRENLYAGGALPNNELELLAYEASYALSSLSSIVSLKIQSLENDLNTDITELLSSWQKVFTGSFMNTIERQISALGPALDDAYYILNKVPRPAAGERSNPDLPSTVIHAITYNLDYWQQVVNKMKTNGPTTGSPSSLDALAQFPTLTRDSAPKLRQALITQAGIWQTLMLGQQTLRSFTAERVTKRILNDFMDEFETWVWNELHKPIQNEVQRLRTPLIVFGILALVIVGGGIVLLAVTGQLQSLAAVIALFVGSALTLVSGFLTRAGSLVAPQGNPPASSSTPANNVDLEQRLGSLFGQAGEAMVTVFQDAYKQILIEFDDLNHNVAISYPLLEFFITNSKDLRVDVKDGYSFLTNVVWNDVERKEELDRVVRAAFGPLGALIGQFAQEPAQKKLPPPAA
jgi:hypothetical protein